MTIGLYLLKQEQQKLVAIEKCNQEKKKQRQHRPYNSGAFNIGTRSPSCTRKEQAKDSDTTASSSH